MPTEQPKFDLWDTDDWTPEDHYEASIGGYYCEHAEEAKNHYVKACSICDAETGGELA